MSYSMGFPNMLFCGLPKRLIQWDFQISCSVDYQNVLPCESFKIIFLWFFSVAIFVGFKMSVCRLARICVSYVVLKVCPYAGIIKYYSAAFQNIIFYGFPKTSLVSKCPNMASQNVQNMEAVDSCTTARVVD